VNTRSDIDQKFLDLFNKLPSSNANPWLAYGSLPTAKAARRIELQHKENLARAAALEAVGDGVVTLSPLLTLPSDEEVLHFANRVREILADKTATRADLLALSPRQFEELIAEIWDRFGFEVELTAQTRDGGRDIIAVKKSAEANYRFLIECKRYRPDLKVGVELIRALYGVKVDEKATKAILATTSTFTADAKRFLQNHLWELDGKDHEDVLAWIQRVRDSGTRQRPWSFIR
jgi:HJR/Mrr/RecB family endonuclease